MSPRTRHASRPIHWAAALTPALVCLCTGGGGPRGADLPSVTQVVFGFGAHRSPAALASAVILAPPVIVLAWRRGGRIDVAAVSSILLLTAWWAS